MGRFTGQFAGDPDAAGEGNSHGTTKSTNSQSGGSPNCPAGLRACLRIGYPDVMTAGFRNPLSRVGDQQPRAHTPH